MNMKECSLLVKAMHSMVLVLDLGFTVQCMLST